MKNIAPRTNQLQDEYSVNVIGKRSRLECPVVKHVCIRTGKN